MEIRFITLFKHSKLAWNSCVAEGELNARFSALASASDCCNSQCEHSISFMYAGDRIQGFVDWRQILYQVSHIPRPGNNFYDKYSV